MGARFGLALFASKKRLPVLPVYAYRDDVEVRRALHYLLVCLARFSAAISLISSRSRTISLQPYQSA
jgi:hypothetical protein